MKTTNKMMADMWENWKDDSVLERSQHYNNWDPAPYNYLESIDNVQRSRYYYRIKPPEKMINWESDDFKVGMILKSKHNGNETTIVGKEKGLNLIIQVPYVVSKRAALLCEHYTLLDGSKLEKEA